jgi:large subunit ribosomal protein L33
MATKKKDIRPVITLECTECKERNYATTKNTRNTTGRLEIKKFCKREHVHTLHKETK